MLSEVLRFVQLRGGAVFSQPQTDLAWSAGPALHVVQHGSIELDLGEGAVAFLAPGDILVLPHSASRYRLRTRLDGTASPLAAARTISATFQFENAAAAASLLRLLPRMIHISAANDSAAVLIGDVAKFLLLEIEAPEPGASLMISRVIDILVIRCIRTWARSMGGAGGWIGGLGDDRVGRALARLHRDPERNWTVAELARVAGMSRSSFASRFVALIGEPPLRYLHNWRLAAAFELLHRSPMQVKDVARSVGYDSEAAFSRAYKSKFGHPPSRKREA
ncbi:AraC family transcriptional regulator [Rhizobium deserti]|uniref:AraC family transcriptional regulator n=1 Tax=Rhizobium deserti TaxID=2547961 RepID=UPI00138714F1|nr:AraC family transcriptional regulator [Rhizobium deserti]